MAHWLLWAEKACSWLEGCEEGLPILVASTLR